MFRTFKKVINYDRSSSKISSLVQNIQKILDDFDPDIKELHNFYDKYDENAGLQKNLNLWLSIMKLDKVDDRKERVNAYANWLNNTVITSCNSSKFIMKVLSNLIERLEADHDSSDLIKPGNNSFGAINENEEVSFTKSPYC